MFASCLLLKALPWPQSPSNAHIRILSERGSYRSYQSLSYSAMIHCMYYCPSLTCYRERGHGTESPQRERCEGQRTSSLGAHDNCLGPELDHAQPRVRSPNQASSPRAISLRYHTSFRSIRLCHTTQYFARIKTLDHETSKRRVQRLLSLWDSN